ncbi:hypothetical protein KPL71_023672 [Citrus sinensis]|uniref:Uncharacterized protein n=1 Tax=Citrus sinensis TaxID=2711 RepID=A0ACB8IKF9_CITSI|nr:hypothetical protein KPL71_023672 [Citrus sinensis]
MLEGSVPVALIFKISYKAMISAFNTQHKFQSKRDETLLLQTDMSKANTVIPKPIQWKDITLPNEWILEGATQLVIPKQLEPNTELQNVTQYSEESNPITVRKKTAEWNLSGSGRIIESEHPPLRSLTIEHGEPPIEIKASPYKVSKHSQKLVQESKSDFAQAIKEQLDRIEASSSFASTSKVQIAPDSAQSSKIGVLEQDQSSIASFDIEAFKDESIPKANKIHWELALPTVRTPPDLAIDNRPSTLNQSRFNASSVYEWNIDGMSEYNILELLQQMTMAANAYKTQQGTSDKAIAEILIAGFTGLLKGWWDYLLTQQQQLDILNSIQVDENGAPILDEFNSPIQDAVATLILTISLHFIGDRSHLRDKNAELLHNLRCRKLSKFQSYKTTFFTRLFLRDDANHTTWKEKFLAGLPTLLGEKVRNSIKSLYNNRIPYDELTYGELVSFVNKEGLKICQDLKLQKRLKWELRKSKQELGSFCKQFNYDPFKTSTLKDCNGHTAKYYRINRRLQEIDLDEEVLSKIAPLLIESSDSDSSSSLSGNSDPLQIMPPKRRDKGKGILTEPISKTTPKASQSSPPKEKLLSSSMPIKSWIDAIEDQEAQSKALASQEQVNEWMKSISKSPELMLALQSFSQSQISPKEEKSISKETSKTSSQNVILSGESSSSQIVLSQTKLQKKTSDCAKTETEYFKVMEQLLASRSEPSVASSGSSSSGEAEPFISLGDENEDDCFGIFPPVKHS